MAGAGRDNRRFSPSFAHAMRRPNPALALVLGAVAAILGAAQLVPAVTRLFQFGAVGPERLTMIATGAVAMLIVLERLKRAWGERLAG